MMKDKIKQILERVLYTRVYLNERKLSNKLNNKSVLITGATFGIGEKLAYLLSKTGANLILAARTAEKLEIIQNDIEKMGGSVIVIPCDLSKSDEVNNLIEKLSKIENGIDLIISNAGKSIKRPVFDSLERFHDFTRTMDINFFGPVKLILSMIPALEKRKGKIINISAISVLLSPAPFWPAYQSSKAAFDQWFRSISIELNSVGIDTTTVYLPLVRTRMIEPTKEYMNMPAMNPGLAAKLIAKAIYSGKRKFSPWWLFPLELASVIFRKQWEYFSTLYLKRKNVRNNKKAQ